jgi:SAM-dependent methyltransferase
MSVSNFKERVPQGFDNPIALPRTAEQQREWQEANRTWWESHPMRYDFSQTIAAAEFSREFYQEIDARFFADVKTFMPWNEVPFDPLIDFASLADKDVLEIGVGNGSHAQLISAHARSYTGIDLTEYAVRSTGSRLQHFNSERSNTKIMRMDAEKMEFPANSFDLIWSWGVIHHSANTRRIVEEIHRVLRPGGVAITMVYYRNIWNYYLFAGLFGGVFNGRLLQSLSWHQARQHMIDGAIARYYSIPEWRRMTGDLFSVEDVKVFGSKSELIPLPTGRAKDVVKALMPNAVARLLTNRCKLGMFLVSTLRKATSAE